jgi:hypothetical protein
MKLLKIQAGRNFGEAQAKEPDTQVDKASVTVKAETKVFINRDGELKPAEFAALKEGQKVEARFTGPVRLSYPVQADAVEITILTNSAPT